MNKKIDKQFVSKCINYAKERIYFFNINNSNVRNSAYTEYCYKKMKKKFKKMLIKEEYILGKETNYVWICWLQGMEKAPDLVKSCYESVKKYMKDKEIIVITEGNYKEYIKFPDYIEKKIKKGCIANAQFSDLLRLELLTTYGGIWIDSTILLTSKPKVLYDNNLFVYKNISLYRKQKLSIVASNWIIKANKNDPIINLSKKLLYKYWEKYNRLILYSIFHVFFTLATEVYREEWEKVPTYSNIPPHILQFELLEKYDEKRFEQIINMSDIHKLNHRIKTDDKDSNYYHILETGVDRIEK